ncbi:MAG: hypothetical protein K2W82_17245 [Candidatus Obscuribacterales bacterium]|jgi:hypothetical protein|nr:hypothetical protein [Candidatus Obscuribacterales bacterium]
MFESLFAEGTLALCLVIFIAGFVLDLFATSMFDLLRDQARFFHGGLFGLSTLFACLFGQNPLVGAILGAMISLLLAKLRVLSLVGFVLANHVYLLFWFGRYTGLSEHCGLLTSVGLISLFIALYISWRLKDNQMTVSKAIFLQLGSIFLNGMIIFFLGVKVEGAMEAPWHWGLLGVALQLNLLAVGSLSYLRFVRYEAEFGPVLPAPIPLPPRPLIDPEIEADLALNVAYGRRISDCQFHPSTT